MVVGGGFCGALSAHLLQYNFNVTLIDQKNFFEFTPSLYRAFVDPSHFSSIHVLHEHYLSRASFLQEEVVEIGTNVVVTSSGRQVP